MASVSVQNAHGSVDVESSRSWTAWLSKQALASDDNDCTQLQAQAQAQAQLQVEVKLQEIRSCLDGDDEVDLWHLRQLALTRGGFLSAQVRKRAWPKLMGAHHQILLQASMSTTTTTTSTSPADHTDSNTDSSSDKQQKLVDVSDRDMQLLQRDIPETVWSIEDCIYNNKNSEQKKVTFQTELTAASPTPSLVALFAKNENGSTCTSPLATTPTTTPQPQYFCATKHRHQHRATPKEQRALQSTLVSVLRTKPENHHDNDVHGERYHYYHGLHDLTALLLINLESPSLSSLILKKLALHPLRDAMRGDDDDSLKTAVQCIFGALFQKVDITLHHHFELHDMRYDHPTAWIAPWFASHVTNLSAASRFLDVFLVSHATMPIYMAVALVCHSRLQLFQTTNLLKELRNLPHNLFEDEETLEDVIALALQYMRLYPPRTLVVGLELSTSITMLQDPPQWSVQATAPTDWTLLQQAKALRAGGTPPPTHHHVGNSHKTYQLATTALGMHQPPQTNKGWKVVVVVVLMAAVAAVYFGGMRVLPKNKNNTDRLNLTPVKTLANPRSVERLVAPPRTMRRKKKPPTTSKTAVKLVHLERKVVKSTVKHNRRHVEGQVHNTTVVQQAMDKSNVWTLKPWMQLMTGTSPLPQVKKPKRQLPKRLEWFIIESHKLRWKGQRFLI